MKERRMKCRYLVVGLAMRSQDNVVEIDHRLAGKEKRGVRMARETVTKIVVVIRGEIEVVIEMREAGIESVSGIETGLEAESLGIGDVEGKMKEEEMDEEEDAMMVIDGRVAMVTVEVIMHHNIVEVMIVIITGTIVIEMIIVIKIEEGIEIGMEIAI